jgi:hypothetical protein
VFARQFAGGREKRIGPPLLENPAIRGFLAWGPSPVPVRGTAVVADQVLEVGEPEFDQLLDAPVPEGTEHDLITSKIDGAVSRFRARGASLDDRRHAVRDLADALEAIAGT